MDKEGALCRIRRRKSMVTAVSRVSRRCAWKSTAELRAAILTECSLQFADLTGATYPASWGERHRQEARRLEREDSDARRALRNESRTAVWDMLGEVSLRPRPSSCAPSLIAATIAAFAGTLRGGVELGSLPRYNGIRTYVVRTFGSELTMPIERDDEGRMSDPSMGPRSFLERFARTRRLTDHELAVLKMLVDIDEVRVTKAALSDGITVGEVIDRERRAIERAREHHGAPFDAATRARALTQCREGVRVLLP
jgi:hypothetical protein